MRTTKFERVTKKIFIVCTLFSLIAVVAISGYDYFYTVKCQSIANDSTKIQSNIDALTLEIQKLGSFDRLNELASANGYTYQSDATAARYVQSDEGVE